MKTGEEPAELLSEEELEAAARQDGLPENGVVEEELANGPNDPVDEASDAEPETDPEESEDED